MIAKTIKLDSVRLLPVYVVLLFITSCTFERPCDEQVEFPVNTGFYFMDDSEMRDTVLEGISLFGIGREDSLLYDSDTTAGISFRLSPFTDSSSMILSYGTLYDTLDFYYERELRMLSPECGFAFLFDIKELQSTGNFIDSVSLLDNKLQSIDAEHLQIFIN